MKVRLYKKVANEKEILDEKVVIKTSKNADDIMVYHLDSYFFTPYITDVVYGNRLNEWFTVNDNEYLFEIK